MKKNNTLLEIDTDAIKQTASIMTTSERNVRYVIQGRHKNPIVKAVYEAYRHGKKVLIEATAEALEAFETLN